jgi:hypothetical protein
LTSGRSTKASGASPFTIAVRLQRGFSAIAVADAQDLLHRGDKNLSVTDPSGSGGGTEHAHHFGSRIDLSKGAVKFSLRQFCDKLGVRTRAQLVKVALEEYRDQL